jgi:putative transposase
LVVLVLLVVCAGELMVIVRMLRLVRRCDAALLLSLERQLRLFREKKAARRRATRREKLILVLLARWIPDWRERCLAFTPRTLMGWKREWVAILVRREGKRVGRPRLSEEMRDLIRRVARENRLWGPGRIMRELAKLGLVVSRNTVRRYIAQVRGPRPRGDQRWSTFIRNHAETTLAMDFAVDYFPSLTGKLRRVWILVLMEIGSRRILRLQATEHPTREWLAQKLREAVPSDHGWRHLIHDNDILFGGIDETIESLGIEPLRTPLRCPRANAHAERFIGTLRRELLDWVWPLGVRHLNRLLAQFTRYYNTSRPHMGLDGAVPDPPDDLVVAAAPRESSGNIDVMAIPHLGGLHHEYRLRRAA